MSRSEDSTDFALAASAEQRPVVSYDDEVNSACRSKPRRTLAGAAAEQFWPVIPCWGFVRVDAVGSGRLYGLFAVRVDCVRGGRHPQSSVSAKMYLPLATWALRYTPRRAWRSFTSIQRTIRRTC